MQIIEFDRPPSWSLDASETGDSTKYRPMGRGGGGHGGQKKLGDCNLQLHSVLCSGAVGFGASIDQIN